MIHGHVISQGHPSAAMPFAAILLLTSFTALSHGLIVPTSGLRRTSVAPHVSRGGRCECREQEDSLAPSLYPNIRGDLRQRPVASAVALAVTGVGGAAVGVIIAGPMGLLLGSAIGWSVGSFGDTIAAAVQRRLRARMRALEEELPLLREEELQEESDPRLREEMVRRLNGLL